MIIDLQLRHRFVTDWTGDHYDAQDEASITTVARRLTWISAETRRTRLDNGLCKDIAADNEGTNRIGHEV